MELAEKVDYLNRKGRLPHGWIARISKTYPDKVYYFNMVSRHSTWDCPTLIFDKDAGESSIPQPQSSKVVKKCPEENHNSRLETRHVREHSVEKNRSSRAESNKMCKQSVHGSCSSQLKSPDRQQWVKETNSKKRKSEEITVKSSSPKRQQIKPFKIASVRSPIRAPSPKNCSEKVAVTVQEKGSGPSKSVISKNRLHGLSRRTAVVDPIVRKSSPESSRRLSVFARLSPRVKHNENMSKNEDRKSKSKRRKSKTYRKAKKKAKPDKDTNDPTKKSLSEMSCSANNRSEQDAVQYLNQHGVVDISPGSKVTECPNPARTKNEGKSQEAERATEDVEMLDVSQSSTVESMLAPEPMKLDEYFENEETLMFTHIVIDTNVWLSHLKGIDELKDTRFDGCGPPIVFIPWVVIQELDRLKQKRIGKAVESVRYIYDLLQSKHPRVRGQTSKMAAKDSSYQAECNDDKILQCCEQLCQVLPKEKILLLTNDKNLVNKAVLNDIVAHTWDSLQHHISNIPGVSYAPSASLFEKEPETESAMKIFLDDISCQVKSLLKHLLESTLIPEFQKVFKDYNWEKILAIKAPYSLTDLLFCVKKYWISCYSYVFSANMRTECENLHALLKRTKGLISAKDDILAMLTHAEAICIECRKRMTHLAESILVEIKKLQLVCELHFQKSYTNQRTSPPPKHTTSSTTASGTNAALSVFQHIWSIISNFTTMILNCCDNPSSAKTQHGDIAAFLPQFYQNVHELWTCMQQVLTDVSRDDRLSELHKCLVNFVPALRTDAPPPDTENFTVGSLVELCRDADKRGLLEVGFQQLKDFYTSLDHCIAKNGTLVVRGVNGVM